MKCRYCSVEITKTVNKVRRFNKYLHVSPTGKRYIKCRLHATPESVVQQDSVQQNSYGTAVSCVVRT